MCGIAGFWDRFPERMEVLEDRVVSVTDTTSNRTYARCARAAAGRDSGPGWSGGRLDAHPNRERAERVGADERHISRDPG